MEILEIHRTATRRAQGDKSQSVIDVIASGDLEVLLERVLVGHRVQGEHQNSRRRIRRGLACCR